MVDLRAKPYCLSDEDIAWVEATIASMTDDYFIDICRYLHLDDALLDTLHYHEYFDF